jgi:hypothetical protein
LFLRKNVKEIVAQQRYQTTDDLKQAVRRAFIHASTQMLRNGPTERGAELLCHENDGVRTDTLDNQGLCRVL